MLAELPRGRPADLLYESGLESEPLALNLCPGAPKQLQGFGVAAYLHSDLGQDTVGGFFDPLKLIFLQKSIGRDAPRQIGGAG
jgi:hypothetical protein